MEKFYCFSTLLVGKKKKPKESMGALNRGTKPARSMPEQLKSAKISDKYCKKEETLDALTPLAMPEEPFQVKVEKLFEPGDEKCIEKASSEFEDESSSTTADAQKMIHVDCLGGMEDAYQGSDEHDEALSLRRDFSDFDLQARADSKVDDGSILNQTEFCCNDSKSTSKSDHGGSEFLAKLKRSCSNIERRITERPPDSALKSLSYGDLKKISRKSLGETSSGIQNRDEEDDPSFSPISCASADKVMLRRKSSSKVLPSRSRKLWWKLFLWSHRNLHKKSWIPEPKNMCSVNENRNGGGYSSDTLDPNLYPDKEADKFSMDSQWMAFSMEAASPFDRVNAWVSNLETVCVDDDDNNKDDVCESQAHGLLDSLGSSYGESSKMNHVRSNHHVSDEVIQANNIVQSLHLNLLSSGAYICGMGLKVLPLISSFSNLRSVNLSNNLIVHVTLGALPKGLHTLDLSRNKITTIDGLRDLNRLRVLHLSYNRISRIGHGLSNCSLIKELYLAGNKINNVEGLHRLLKLSVLDLSFNKITMEKSLAQLVANYNSLLALNLLGNPIQTNTSEDQLRKTLSSLIPNLAFLNKQAIKPKRSREVATVSIARAALGDNNSGWNSRRKTLRQVNQGSGLTSSSRGRASAEGNKSRSSRSRSRV